MGQLTSHDYYFPFRPVMFCEIKWKVDKIGVCMLYVFRTTLGDFVFLFSSSVLDLCFSYGRFVPQSTDTQSFARDSP